MPDGVYLYSIDTGSLPVGNGSSREYCVSQRVQIAAEKIVRLVGQAHGCTPTPSPRATGASAAGRPCYTEQDADEHDVLVELQEQQVAASRDSQAEITKLKARDRKSVV